VYEGHFTNDETWKTPMRFKENGYTVNLIFLGLSDPDLSATRVLDRTNTGGHYVPRSTIEDNFYGNLEKLNKYHGLITNLSIIDTSQTKHVLLAGFTNDLLISSIPYNELPDWFTRYLPQLAEKIKL
jgi:predicted ABC-type ATPase